MRAHALSREQTDAVHEVMQLFVEDDLAHGVSHTERRLCPHCRHRRRAAGFIVYGATALCNGCATAFELARLRHVSTPVVEFVARAWPA